jgi:uncharacterized protein YbjT (DUF2867 family)
MNQFHCVTGAFGYSGKYIAKALIEKGHSVITLTNSLNRPNPFGDKVKAYPFHYDNPQELVKSLQGVKVLYNTYWVRFNHKTFTHKQAVQNTITLFRSAKEAGVKKIVHVSIANPSIHSRLEYYHGKAVLEEELIKTGVSYSIIRPTVIFGQEDVLINNIAWMIRYLPIVGVFSGKPFHIQPIYVEDMAKLAIEQGENPNNNILDAVGPETFEYRELIETIASLIQKKVIIMPVPKWFGYLFTGMLGFFLNDTILTWEEILGLTDDLLCSKQPPTGKTKLTDWVKEHKDTLGKKYTNEIQRRLVTNKAY